MSVVTVLGEDFIESPDLWLGCQFSASLALWFGCLRESCMQLSEFLLVEILPAVDTPQGFLVVVRGYQQALASWAANVWHGRLLLIVTRWGN
ncbi:MAG: hypothetical protein OEV08_08790 [Nitrospira sp.]|nr:hypothetical protein [Nitrospira sp.]